MSGTGDTEMNKAWGPVVKEWLSGQGGRKEQARSQPGSSGAGGAHRRRGNRGGCDEPRGAGGLRAGTGTEDAKARGATPDVTVGDSQQKLKEGNGRGLGSQVTRAVPAWLSSSGFTLRAAGRRCKV